MLNLGESYYYEAAPEGEYQTEYTDRGRVIPVKLKRYLLKPGMIVLIDTKKLHSAEQLSEVRYNHTFRYIKDEYLSLVQS